MRGSEKGPHLPPDAADVTTARRARTRRAILDAAWELAAEQGLDGWTLRDLGARIGVRAPSLYVYFDGKPAIFDALFADGYRQLLEVMDALEPAGDVEAQLRTIGVAFLGFATADGARFQLLFLRTLPGFEPSAASYALAEQVLARLDTQLTGLGFDRPGARDLWTALVTGLASQQLSNDPGGRRWTRLLDRAIAMYVAAERRDDSA